MRDVTKDRYFTPLGIPFVGGWNQDYLKNVAFVLLSNRFQKGKSKAEFGAENKMASVSSPKNQVDDHGKPECSNGLDHLDSTQCIERFRKYDAEYTQRLLAKYFTTKSSYGGNMFDEQITIDDEIIKASRLTCLRTYVDPVVGFEDQGSNGSTPPADTQANIPNGKHVVKKNN
ncbi:uncharacterized protein LOC113852986 [Abrus precatorius]|uniref:Uncharacterized protein LOC113852986 n=1 Tax=Abrus precatorius TaxID=3816 RepID=A0A8B8K631_ABRPR|nr:uncharacterized protein LOC113852986 [Abrus precatorius]